MRRCFGILLVLALALPASAYAQQSLIGIKVDNGVQDGCSVSLIPGIHSLSIRLDATVAPVKTARFKVVSSCPVVFFGTPANQEYDLTFPTCLDAGGELENFGIQVFGSTQVCTIKVVPVTGSTGIELTDCDGHPMGGAATYDENLYCDSRLIAPYLPDPPSGATGVSINPLLSYVGPANLVLLGTSPALDPDAAETIICTSHNYPPGEPPCTLPLTPGPLAPNTTYYWRALNVCFGCEHGDFGASDVFTFTTGSGTVATRSATWGYVKSIYRN
jgi:hypothetical protein